MTIKLGPRRQDKEMAKPVCQTTEDYHKVKNTHVIVALKTKRAGKKKTESGMKKNRNIRMPKRPFLISRFPHPPTQNMMDGSSSRPTGRCIMELKQGFCWLPYRPLLKILENDFHNPSQRAGRTHLAQTCRSWTSAADETPPPLRLFVHQPTTFPNRPINQV